MSAAQREPILYRWWDERGMLLYVGKSISVFARMQQHRRTSPFFSEAQSMTMERFTDEAELSVAEMKAIREECPVFNIQGAYRKGEPRRIIIATELPEAPDTTVGHWEPVAYNNLWIEQIVRWTVEDYTHVGYVDDEFSDDDDGLGPGWVVLTDMGEIYELTEMELGLADSVDVWMSAASNDAFRDEVLKSYYANRPTKARVAA